MVIGDNNGSCTRNLYFALRANGEAYPILPEMKQQLWTLPIVREGKTTDMWYVIQVQGGQEEKTAELIRSQVSAHVMEECFIPKKERVKKFRGRWQRVEEILFPGYVFTATNKPEELFLELKNVLRLTKILQDGAFYFIPLSGEEEKLIQSIGDNCHITRISRVQVKKKIEPAAKKEVVFNNRMLESGREIMIIDGPLKNQEGRIVKYNLHKREATVKLRFMGTEMELRLAIELVEEKRQ